MIDQYVSQLDSPDAERRKKAVIALGKSGDRAALPHLSRVYKNDANPEIRELALKAGRYLKRETEEQQQVSTSLYDDEPVRIERDEPSPYLPPADVEVSPRDEQRAKELMEQALDWHMRGQDNKATDYLAKALTINPRLRRDPYTSSLAATITGMNADEALASLSTSSKPPPRKEKPKNDDGKPAKSSEIKDVGWGDATIDLMLYGLVWAGGLIAIILFALEGLSFIVNSAILTSSSTPLPEGTEEFLAMLPQLRIQLVIAAIVVGLISAIVLLLQCFIIHFSAVSILGGDGNLPTLIHGIVPTYIATNILWIVVLVGYIVYVGVSSVNATAAQIRSMNDLGSNLSWIFQFGVALWVGHLIGRVYRFGMLKGCLAEFIGGILFGVLGVGLVCCAPTMLAMLGGGGAR